MKEALHARIQLIHLLANTRHNIIQQAEPGKPTKAYEAASLLRSGLKVLSDALGDAEPSPITLTEEQQQLALIKNGQVAIRARKLVENLERLEAALLSNHSGETVFDWTPEQVEAARIYLSNEITAMQAEIEAL